MKANERLASLLDREEDLPAPLEAAAKIGLVFGVLALVRGLTFVTFGESSLAWVALAGIAVATGLQLHTRVAYAGSLAMSLAAGVASVVLLVVAEKGVAPAIPLGVSVTILVLLLAPPQSRRWFLEGTSEKHQPVDQAAPPRR